MDSRPESATTAPNSGKVFRVMSDGTGLTTLTGVENPYAIAFSGSIALITGGYRRVISAVSIDMLPQSTFSVPWDSLLLDPYGNGDVGMLSGIAVTPDGLGFYVTNEGGQTAGERSTYGRTDGESGFSGGTFYTDLTHDDNDPILHAGILKPVGVNNRAALTDAKLVGREVKVWGTVKSVNSTTSFTIGDGSETYITVNVSGATLPTGFETGKMAVVTGILVADKTVQALDIKTP